MSELLRELLDRTDDLVAVIRAGDGRCLHANRPFEAFLGAGAGSLVGTPLSSALEQALGPAAAAMCDEARSVPAQGSAAATERWFDGGSLGPTGLRYRWQAWRSQEGPALCALFARPLEERRSAARRPAAPGEPDAHERQREAMRHADRLSAMGRLLASVSHELNNPLAIVLSRAALLEEKCDDDRLRDDVVRLREAAQRCGRIVRTFLNMARSRPPQVGPVDLNALAEAACELIAYGLRSHGITIEFALDPDLPAVEADADQVGQVLLNLLVNAQQALQRHDGPRSIRVESRAGAGHAELRVADSGPGVAPELRDRIFDLLFTTKPAGSGTGLGLSVSRTLLREHGGELALCDGPLPGACFVVRLPRAAAVAPLDAADEDARPTVAMGGRVLVVDDEPEVADLIRDLLEGAGYEVACVDSGGRALAWLDGPAPDVIVSDLRMPDMDGERLYEAVAARDAQLARRMLFVTGDTLSPDSEAMLRDSGCLHLEKPFDNDALLQAVADLANRV